METKVIKIGNSLGIIISKKILQNAGITKSDVIVVEEDKTSQ